MSAEPIAPLMASAISSAFGHMPIRLRAWDQSEAGPVEAPLVELRSPRALRRLLWHPGELGAAQAYVTGEAEIHGDLDTALSAILGVGRSQERPALLTLATALRRIAPLLREPGVIGPALSPPATQASVRGALHSKGRDRRVISHHYDLSNEFFSLILGETMAYSCAYFGDPDQDLDLAQAAKLSLICDKLGLQNGHTLLDMGCGWGSLAIHAARRFGARVLAVTLSAQQRDFVQTRIDEGGLADLVEVRLCDYRDVDGTFDAVASVEMGEHVGERNYGVYADRLYRRVRPGGRVLLQQMSRRGPHPGGGPFIESFIAPDMTMRPVGETVGFLERAGLEVRDVHALREHYVYTVERWIARLEAQVDRVTELIGEEAVRVWRLYLVGGAAAFRDGRMGVDQILAVRPGLAHDLPRVRAW